MIASKDDVENRARQMCAESQAKRGDEPKWDGRGVNRAYWRRLARRALEWRA